MRPIRDIAEVRPDSVLYHSAFGFASVAAVSDDVVTVTWERPGENLPPEISQEHLTRVYALCREEGFFHRAMRDPDGLRELLQVDPPGALVLLLDDLYVPQRTHDVRDWVVGRHLMSERAFDRWWETVAPLVAEDDRILLERDELSLRRGPAAVEDRLESAMLSPGRRLDLALLHRADLSEEAFRDHILRAWTTGGKQVRDLALAALEPFGADVVLVGLLAQGADSTDAIIHAIRHGPWRAGDVSAEVRTKLVDRVRAGMGTGGPLDAEGRLVATLARWGSDEAVALLAASASSESGQHLLRAALAALPPKRSEALALQLMDALLRAGGSTEEAQWLASEVLIRVEEDSVALAERLDGEHPTLAAWFRNEYEPTGEEMMTDEVSAELEIERLTDPTPLSALPERVHGELIRLGLATARALAHHHHAGNIVNPNRDSVLVHPDGSVAIDRWAAPEHAPRTLGEPATTAGDVYAAAVLLVESLVGKNWPRNVPAWRALPYIRHIVPHLPPSALAPLDAALNPLASRRPQAGLPWLVRWQAAAVAEEARSLAEPDREAKLRIGFDSHVGRMKLLQTQTNQDALYVSSRGSMHLMICCDGISTATAGSGDVASGTTVHVVANLWEQAITRLALATEAEVFDFLDRALRMANQAVCEAALRFAGGRLEGRVPMGTTVVVAIARGNRICLAWLGDSRAYIVGRYGAAMVTADHNQAGERLVAWEAGIDPWWDPAGFALIGYIGHFDEENHAEALPPSRAVLTLLPGERFVICSDGVTDYVGETHPEVAEQIAAAMVYDEPDECARALSHLANRGGGGDNCTAIVATLAD